MKITYKEKNLNEKKKKNINTMIDSEFPDEEKNYEAD